MRTNTLIVTGEMKAIKVDAERRVAIIQPGVTTEELRKATIEHGLHFPSGHISSVGMSGFVLGGGNGWGVRHCGSGADNLIEAEVVLPSGLSLGEDQEEGSSSRPVVKRVSAESDPELFWGLRGAGTFLGIVTSFTLALYPVPLYLPCLTAIYPLSALDQVGQLFIEIQRDSPREVEISLALARIPNPNGGGQVDAAIIGCVSFLEQGSNQGIEAVLDRLRSFQPIGTDGSEGSRIALLDSVPSYLEALASLDDAWSFPGLRMYSHGAFVQEEMFDGGLIKVLQGLAESFTSSRSMVLVAPAGAHPSKPRASSFGFSGCWFVAAYAMWEGGEGVDVAEEEKHVAWVRGYASEVNKWSKGLYLNEVMMGTEGLSPSMCYEEWAVGRIRELKGRCDSSSLLREFD